MRWCIWASCCRTARKHVVGGEISDTGTSGTREEASVEEAGVEGASVAGAKEDTKYV